MGKYFFSLLPMVLPMAGAYLKFRDTNSTGADDTFGDLMIVATPAIAGLQSGDESKVRKALKAIRDICDAYLAQSPA